ncbi:hypothetical protein Dsin_018793 [Dipteronia sinensis]|uniref:Polygalacturonase n=1 Tax=Dipteronia sinensis TaxID=43782 RepID=A0AAE0E1X3_9ROSI|nr:hypothetical protein Dsin_018793 [Dipteronia sinensis]
MKSGREENDGRSLAASSGVAMLYRPDFADGFSGVHIPREGNQVTNALSKHALELEPIPNPSTIVTFRFNTETTKIPQSRRRPTQTQNPKPPQSYKLASDPPKQSKYRKTNTKTTGSASASTPVHHLSHTPLSPPPTAQSNLETPPTIKISHSFNKFAANRTSPTATALRRLQKRERKERAVGREKEKRIRERKRRTERWKRKRKKRIMERERSADLGFHFYFWGLRFLIWVLFVAGGRFQIKPRSGSNCVCEKEMVVWWWCVLERDGGVCVREREMIVVVVVIMMMTLACSSVTASTIYVPKGRYLIKAAVFRGACKNRITFLIDGTIVAPTDYRSLGNSGFWILFIKVDRLTLIGGTLDAKGAGFWACTGNPEKNCPVGARALNSANNVVITGLTSINSQLSHLVISSCNNVVVSNVKFFAPDQSPNTDGIHVESSTGVTITGSTLQTGDDCISICPGTRNMLMNNIKCGPGHGISICSLGKQLNEEGVQNVTLSNAVFIGSDNGVRIKSWARASNSFVRNVVFQNIIMNDVDNPILIEQNYCPDNKRCPRQTSGVKISQVTYRNIKGTSATPEAVTFDCSPSNPCRGIRLQDIKLTFMNRAATSSCKNICGTSIGVLMPESCL